MDISEAKTILLLAGEYRVLTNYYRALNPGSDVEIRAGYLETWLIIWINGVKFDLSVEYFCRKHTPELLVKVAIRGSSKPHYSTQIPLPRLKILTDHFYFASMHIITLIIAECLLDDLAQHNS